MPTRLNPYKNGLCWSPRLREHADADFAGGWKQADSSNAENVMPQTNMVIMYANCIIYWRSSWKTEISLSTTEAEYIALSSALQEVLPLMTMMEEINKVFPLLIQNPKFVCQVHEDNQSCIKMPTGTKISPRTKHIALNYHHFRSNVKYGLVEITYTPTDKQLPDILTKSLSNEAFFTLQNMLCGCGYTSKKS